MEDVQHENDTLKKRLAESEDIRGKQQQEIADAEKARQSLEKNRLLQQEVIADYEKNRQEYEQTRLEQKAQLNKLIDETKSLRDDQAELLEMKAKMQSQLDDASDYIIMMEEKVYKSNRISLELLKQLKDAELEIAALKAYIIDLKSRIAIYIPMKQDHVDMKLAEFINNYPERQKLKIMFMRESDGVYQFGSKKVAVKVEKDQIKIRVGGGYLSIDEFLDQYTPIELEKLERKDPLKRFSEKVAM